MPDETIDAYRQLSVPAAADPQGLSRRRFLQAALGGFGTAALVPSWLASDAFAAPPIGPTDGVLVLILMAGGNDGLNTVVPYEASGYYRHRGPIAIEPRHVLKITPELGLHPSLPWLKRMYDNGNVAVVQGVGYQPPDLSHFTSMAIMMSAVTSGPSPTGWIGRYLDALDSRDPLHAVSVGTSTPLHCVGATTKATALPSDLGSAFGANQSDPSDARMFSAIRQFAAAPTGLGSWGDSLATMGAQTMDLATTVAPAYSPELPTGSLRRQLALCARLINANVGLRVLCVSYGDFDNHASQPTAHAARLAELDGGVRSFYDELDPAFGSRVTLMTFSEFGRRVPANNSRGTDHGAANNMFVIGRNVAGGVFGEHPSINILQDGNLAPTVDFRSVYSTVLESWLAADPAEVLGTRYENLGLFARGPGD